MSEPVQVPGAAEAAIEQRADRADEHAQALAKQAPASLKDSLQGEKFRKAVAEVAPTVMRPERFVRAALIAMMRTPLLAECTRESFFQSMLDCAFYGLEPDRRRAHLIPFKNNKRGGIYECQLIIDYKGLVDLVMRSGEVSMIHADAVYEGDKFHCVIGTESHLSHEHGDERVGKPKKFYSFVKFKDGREKYEIMTLTEVEKIRARSKSPNEGPWVTDFNEMGKKTVFKRQSKWLPLSSYESRFSLDREQERNPEVIEPVTNTWSDMIGQGEPQAQPLGAKERVMNPPSLDEPEPATTGAPTE
jgi:recombination protein RecT